MAGIEELADIFKALSDPTRLKIVKLLNSHPNMLCVNSLTKNLHVTQSAISQHLRTLRQVGLVFSERRGCYIHYAVNKNKFKEIEDLLKDTLGKNGAEM